jgi:DNA-binding transcriptional MerR regulator
MLHTNNVPKTEIAVSRPAIEEKFASISVSVAVAARRLGIAPATLRTWDRRYGLGPSQRDGGTHRRYSPADLARLDYMSALIRSGGSPADSAAAALSREFTQGEPLHHTNSQPHTPVGRVGGGNVVATPGCDRRARGLAKAASALDQVACASIISESLRETGVIPTWNGLSTAIQVEFARFASEATTQATRGLVVLGSLTGDDHQLPLWAVAAGLAEQGIRFIHLGGGMPMDSLGDVITRTGPRAVFLWSQVRETADSETLAALPSLRPNPRIVIGGPGWMNTPPDGIHVAATLLSAVALISEVMGD